MAGRRITATPIKPEASMEESSAFGSPLDAPEEFPLLPEEIPGEAPEEEDRRKVDESSEEEVTELTDEERTWFSSLLTCGRRYKTITVMGDHKVAIQTLTGDDDLRIGLYTKSFRDSDAYPRAYQIAVCAAGIRTVDDRPLYQPITESEDADAVFAEKLERMRKFYPVVITEIYRAIIELDGEFAELARKLGKLSG